MNDLLAQRSERVQKIRDCAHECVRLMGVRLTSAAEAGMCMAYMMGVMEESAPELRQPFDTALAEMRNHFAKEPMP